MAGTARMQYPPNVHIIRVNCSGRVDPSFILKAFREGADGVLVAGCHPATVTTRPATTRRCAACRCWNASWPTSASSRRASAWNGSRRPKGARWARVVNEMTEQVRAAGAVELEGAMQARHAATAQVAQTRSGLQVGRTMPEKLKLALYWAATCGGCDVAVLDLNEKILDLAAAADIYLWPVAMDFKYHDAESWPDGFIDVCLFNGAIRNSEGEHMAHLLRRKSKTLVAFGSCACFGGIPGLANQADAAQIFDRVYQQTPSTVNPDGIRPQTATQMCRGRADPAGVLRHRARPGPGGGRRLLPARLPACARAHLGGDRRHRRAAQLPPKGLNGRRDRHHGVRGMQAGQGREVGQRLCPPAPDPARSEALPAGAGHHLPGAGDARRLRRAAASTPGCRAGAATAPPTQVADQGAKMLCAIASILKADDDVHVRKSLDGIWIRSGRSTGSPCRRRSWSAAGCLP